MLDVEITGIFLGAFTGIVLALTGAGGAIIAVPLLVFGLHLVVAEAAPIALLAVCLSTTVGAVLALIQGKVRYRAAGFIAITGAVAAPVGLWLAQILPNAPLALLFAIVLAYVAVDMFRKSMHSGEVVEDLESKSFAAPCLIETNGKRLVWTVPCVRALGFSGLSAGFLSGLLGVGGGFVVMPALKRMTNLQMQSILATSLAVVALISATAATSAVLIGNMNWSIAIPFTGGAVAGMLLGRMFSSHFTGPKLQQSFALLAICASIGMIVKVILDADFI